jgi:hypothetical protein
MDLIELFLCLDDEYDVDAWVSPLINRKLMIQNFENQGKHDIL